MVTATVRSLEAACAQAGLPALVLMEHAGRAVAAVAARWAPAGRGPVAVLCGPGNNGGDGYAAARHLALWGFEVTCWHAGLPSPACPDAALEARLAAGGLPVRDLREHPAALRAALPRAALLVDALFGVGLTRPLAAPWTDLVAALNAAPGLRLSVDVPRGLDADSGEARPCAVRADVTVALLAVKRGYAPGAPGAQHAGHVVVADIGVPRQLLARRDASNPAPT